MKTLRTVLVGVTLLAMGTPLVPAVLMAQEHPKAAPKATVSAEAAGTVAAPASTGAAASAAASAASASSVNKSAIPTSITIVRETFDYARTGRRDPYKSLMTSTEIRPLISDLRLMSVAFDSSGAHSVALLRDINTKERYQLKIGQQLGRLRVAAIKHKSVVFSIDEFGFNRQETLQMGSDTTKTRTP